jgi:hypothetical protein
MGHDVPVRGDGWSRIADDVRATTGRELHLRMRPSDEGWFDVDVQLDGTFVESFGHAFATENEAFVAELADHLQESVLHEEIWGGWPMCPDHGSEPLDACVDDAGDAIWRCRRTRSAIARIGSLPRTT